MQSFPVTIAVKEYNAGKGFEASFTTEDEENIRVNVTTITAVK